MKIIIYIFAVIGFLVTCAAVGCLLSYWVCSDEEYEEWNNDLHK